MKTTSWMRLCIYTDNPSLVKDILDTHSRVQGYALALHDKFTPAELQNEKGDSHVHVVLHLNRSLSFNDVQKWFSKLDGNCLSTSCENPLGAYEYLTHKNDPDKYQFSTDIVTETAGFRAECEATNKAGSAHRPDHTAEIFSSYLEGTDLRTLVAEHGKDFLYHYNQYKAVKIDLVGNVSRETFAETKARVLNSLLLNIITRDPDLVGYVLEVYHDSHLDDLTLDEASVLGEVKQHVDEYIVFDEQRRTNK